MLTAQILHQLAPRCKDPGLHAQALEAARQVSTVNTPKRLAAFLGQVLVETAGLTRLEENLRYRDPKHLDTISYQIKTPAEAQALIDAGPEAIANRFYGGRLGNGPEASGDGWRFRGSGYLQITGRANYRTLGRLVGLDLVADPDLARVPETAARVAFEYWDALDLSALADSWRITEITRKVNGPAMLHRKARVLASNRALQALAKN